MADIKYGFTSHLVVRQRSNPIDGKWFTVYEPLDYVSKSGETYRVPIGTNTDFASIPRGLRWLIPRVGRHGKAAVLHDWLCEFVIVPRPQADLLFREAMESLGVGWTKRNTMYRAVAAYTAATRKSRRKKDARKKG